jgi:hypothetical protein
LRYVEHIVHMR